MAFAMGKVRYYDADLNRYVTLRVEDDGVYIDGLKLAIHKERKRMPPKINRGVISSETSAQAFARLADPDILEKVLAVLVDIEQTCRLDDKALATLKPAYKKSGFDFAVKYRDTWTTVTGQTMLEALLSYFAEVLSAD